MKIAFVGGGTGGHIFPIKALIEYILKNKELFDDDLKEYSLGLFRIGEKDSLEQKVAEELNVKFYPILSGKIRRYFTPLSVLQNFIDIFRLIIGFFQSLFFLYKNKIDIIFCKGGYVALPVVLAGAILRKKIYVHESDTVSGLTNKIASKFAKKVFWGYSIEDNRRFLKITEDNISSDFFSDKYPDKSLLFKIISSTYKSLGGEKKVISVGQILSEELIEGIQQDSLSKSDKINILVIGGSQGAKVIFDTLISIAKSNLYRFEGKRRNIMIDEKFKFFIVLGTKNKGYKHNFTGFENVEVFEFVDQKKMGQLLYMADRSITRGGATSLAEQDIFGIKKIVIPLPFTAHNHQYRNGLWYKTFRGDILMEQDENLKENLEKVLFSNLEKKRKLNIDEIKDIIDIPKKVILDEILNG